jgi:hypothetical protein
MTPGRAVIGTSKLQLDLLTERFHTLFQSITSISLPSGSGPMSVSGASRQPVISMR